MKRNLPFYVPVPTDGAMNRLKKAAKDYSDFFEIRGIEGGGSEREVRCATCRRYIAYVPIFLKTASLECYASSRRDTGPIRPKTGGLDAL